MKIIIIEDEKPAARLLKRRVDKLGFEVTEMLHSVEESVAWLQENSAPDLIFLDIQLSDGLSFEIFNQVEISSAIIFTTAYDEYVLKAFKLNSIDYLLKPVDEEELKFALEKFEKQFQSSQTSIDIDSIKKLFSTSKTQDFKERYSIKIGNSIKIIETENIECFFSENKASFIHTKENKNYLVDYSLEKIEEQLDPKKFFRINRSQIIRIDSIKEITVYSNSRLKIILQTYNESELIVSREKVTDFKKWLEK
ncbi:two component transcriptional regulator, LytTR family [Chishuiella changwenlii]|uniref:DNA-binding response regulator n=1 Tax=Chishuiella changwenlii TaxID=1434701 RepID=A0A1M7CCP6_9FLAO|nr:LytTR family DNA-binding domain-containing protein [Chishuiella changwenlii]GGF06448.1 DNA-binding response regulator [Chishuiella changwenlii]SHL65022.1 two component transcriptional regulator, LytTR family [Chishuiella changwenlii]